MSLDLSLAASIRLEALRDAAACCSSIKAEILAAVRVSDTPLVQSYLLGIGRVEDRINLMIAAVEAVWQEELNDCSGRTED